MNLRNNRNKIVATLWALLLALMVAAVLSGAQENRHEKEKEKEKESHPAKVNAPPPKHVEHANPRVQHTNAPPTHVEPRVNPNVVRPPKGAGPSPQAHPTEGKFEKPMVRPSKGAGPSPEAHPTEGRFEKPMVRPSGGGANPPTAVHGRAVVNRPMFRPPTNATRVVAPAGGATYKGSKGQQWTVDRYNHVTAFTRPGMQASFRPNGRVHTLQVTRPDHSVMTIRGGLRGGRETIVTRPGGVRVVTYGRHRGYVERPLGRPGYISRTYVVGGRSYVHVYRPYHYHGIHYYRYVPAYYYHPRFYHWVFNPWQRPVVFVWGWGPDPWFGFYGGYFAPAPVYPSAALWLTDFLLAENLRLAYQAEKAREREEQEEQEQPPPPVAQPSSGEVTLTPEVKAAIAEEVRRQIEAEQAAAQQPPAPNQPPEAVTPSPTAESEALPAAMDPNQRMFVVSQNLDVSEGDQPCSLTPGDVIYRTGDNLLDGNKVAVNVLTSKAGDCPANSATEIDVEALQEMHNQFHAQIDAGLQTLAADQGKKGLPSSPPPDAVAVPEGTAQPDPDAASELMEQQQEADQAEGEAEQGASGGS
jgi:hypothetical protein